MKNIKIVRLQYSVKIDVDNNYSIYPFIQKLILLILK